MNEFEMGGMAPMVQQPKATTMFKQQLKKEIKTQPKQTFAYFTIASGLVFGAYAVIKHQGNFIQAFDALKAMVGV